MCSVDYWWIYRLFEKPYYEQKKENRCSTCKFFVGTASLGGSIVNFAFMRRNRNTQLKWFGFAGAGCALLGFSLLNFRLAYDYKKFNDLITKEFAPIHKEKYEKLEGSPS